MSPTNPVDLNPSTTSPLPPSSDSAPQRQESTFLLPPHPLSTSRYHRQLLVPSVSIRGQEAISKAKVLIVGLGGLGSPASLYLAGAGIGTLGLVDADAVDRSNLHRQIVHAEASVGRSKVESALGTLRGVNSEVRYVAYPEEFTAENAVGIVEGEGWGRGEGEGEGEGEVEVEVEGGYDVVVDCTDNPASRYLISDVCVVLGRVLVSGAAQRGEGQLMRLNYPPYPTSCEPNAAAATGGEGERAKGPCYRCIFPNPPAPETVQSCSETGILGPVVGVMGTLMAMEVLNIITAPLQSTAGKTVEAEAEAGWRPNLLLYNALSLDPRGMFRNVGLRRAARRDCLACGDEEGVLKGLGRRKITRERIKARQVDYRAWCGRVQDVRVLEPERRVTAEEFVERIMCKTSGQEEKDDDRALVVDVRETVEFELGATIRHSINIPISRILRLGQMDQDEDGGGGAGDLFGLGPDRPGEEGRSIYFVCQRGNDSQIAARKLLDAESGKERSRWIGDVVGGFDALQKLEHSSSDDG